MARAARDGRSRSTWTGRVLEPDGTPIEHCSMSIEKSDHTTAYADCGPAGFAFGVLPAGESTVRVRLDHHALGTWRVLKRTVTIAPNASTRNLPFSEYRFASTRPSAGD